MRLEELLYNYDQKFIAARNRTMNDPELREMGYIIYEGTDGNTYISDLIVGTEGTMNPRDEYENPSGFPMGVDAAKILLLYHTHPPQDAGSPISDGDFEVVFNYLQYGNVAPRLIPIGSNFVLVADDTGGGRYALVIEDFELAKANLEETKTRYYDNNNPGGVPPSSFSSAVRELLGEIITPNTGLGIYYSESFSYQTEILGVA